MTSLKESVLVALKPHLINDGCDYEVQKIGEWAESYIKQLKEHMRKFSEAQSNFVCGAFNVAEEEMLRFLRGEP